MGLRCLLALLILLPLAPAPKAMFFGAANSAFQVEGLPMDSNWYRFSHQQPSRVRDGTNSDIATLFWSLP